MVERENNVGSTTQGVKSSPPITLLTDFGLDDIFVGVMKGVILGKCPNAKIIDLTHGIPPQDVLAGCLALEDARPFFPKGSIHAAVVDPGVGTDRAALAVKTEKEIYIAPDNGLLSFLPQNEIVEARFIENPRFMLNQKSATFHGRDVFAPAAAELAAGIEFKEIGPIASKIKRILEPGIKMNRRSTKGEIIAFDRFGNAATNIKLSNLPSEPYEITYKGMVIPMVRTYSEAPDGALACLVNSSARLEISVKNASARDIFKIERFDAILIKTSVD